MRIRRFIFFIDDRSVFQVLHGMLLTEPSPSRQDVELTLERGKERTVEYITAQVCCYRSHLHAHTSVLSLLHNYSPRVPWRFKAAERASRSCGFIVLLRIACQLTATSSTVLSAAQVHIIIEHARARPLLSSPLVRYEHGIECPLSTPAWLVYRRISSWIVVRSCHSS